MSARIYRRRNFEWGAACDGCRDTGHFVKAYSPLMGQPSWAYRFSVRSVHEPFNWIARYASRETAERRIQADWRKQS